MNLRVTGERNNVQSNIVYEEGQVLVRFKDNKIMYEHVANQVTHEITKKSLISYLLERTLIGIHIFSRLREGIGRCLEK